MSWVHIFMSVEQSDGTPTADGHAFSLKAVRKCPVFITVQVFDEEHLLGRRAGHRSARAAFHRLDLNNGSFSIYTHTHTACVLLLSRVIFNFTSDVLLTSSQLWIQMKEKWRALLLWRGKSNK